MTAFFTGLRKIVIPSSDDLFIAGQSTASLMHLLNDLKKNVDILIGVSLEEIELETPANGATVVVNPSTSQKQVITNNVAGFTIAATEEVGDVELRIINGASAGTITFDGFNKEYPGGAVLDTTEGNEFVAFIFGFGAAGADYVLQARQ